MQPSVLRSARRVLVRLKDRLAVCVQGGLLQGIHFGSDPNAAAFGVPYAAPPMGELRWKPLRRAPRWAGTRKAINFVRLARNFRCRGGRGHTRVGVGQKQMFLRHASLRRSPNAVLDDG
jgi:hypothetical protein